MTKLNDLPHEIILLSIDHLSFLDALRFSETCKEYYDAVETAFSNLEVEEIALK